LPKIAGQLPVLIGLPSPQILKPFKFFKNISHYLQKDFNKANKQKRHLLAVLLFFTQISKKDPQSI
jgi:hypothetical protein